MTTFDLGFKILRAKGKRGGYVGLNPQDFWELSKTLLGCAACGRGPKITYLSDRETITPFHCPTGPVTLVSDADVPLGEIRILELVWSVAHGS